MCDSCAEGGRRCPGSMSPEARAAHNTRRRQNRTARAAVVSWARQRDMPQLALDVLAVAPPAVAKRWAEDAGAPEPTELGEQKRLKPTETGLRDASWATPASSTRSRRSRAPRARTPTRQRSCTPTSSTTSTKTRE